MFNFLKGLSSPKTHLIHIEMSEESDKALVELGERTGSKDRVVVIAKALSAYDYLTKQQEHGYVIYKRKGDVMERIDII